MIVVFSLFSILLLLFGQKNAFGAGDIKLYLGIATVWGWKIASMCIYFSFVVGGIVGFYLMIIKKRNKNEYIPFAPAIIIGLIIALIYTDSIFDYYYPWVNNSFTIENNFK